MNPRPPSRTERPADSPPSSDALDDLYRALPDADLTSSPALDARIQTAARQALPARRTVARPTPPRPWWRQLLIPLSMATVAMLSVGLVLTGISPNADRRPVRGGFEERIAMAPPPAPAPAAASPPAPAPEPAPTSAPPPPPTAAARAPAPVTSIVPPGSLRAEAQADTQGRAANRASAPLARERSTAEASRLEVERAAADRADPAWTAPRPEERLRAIESLLDRGDREQARAALAAFVKRFPDTPLSERLRALD